MLRRACKEFVRRPKTSNHIDAQASGTAAATLCLQRRPLHVCAHCPTCIPHPSALSMPPLPFSPFTRVPSSPRSAYPLQTALQRYRAAKMQSLAETTRGANEKLEEAKAMIFDADSGAGPRGRSVEDCPRDNAKRYVRAWARETWRAERAERVAARRPSTDFRQVRGEFVVRVPCGRLYRLGTYRF